MKTAKEILIENDCYQDGIRYSLKGRIISTDLSRFEKAMRQYAGQLIDEIADSCQINNDNWNPDISKKDVLAFKDKLK